MINYIYFASVDLNLLPKPKQPRYVQLQLDIPIDIINEVIRT